MWYCIHLKDYDEWEKFSFRKKKVKCLLSFRNHVVGKHLFPSIFSVLTDKINDDLKITKRLCAHSKDNFTI